MSVYYNEIDPYLCQWLKNLMAAGLIPAGDVDDRDIRSVSANDVRGYAQCHFFAGVGGFAYAARLAAWPDDAPLWTGGFPCQPFSVAGNQRAQADDRHLWPELRRLIAQARPALFLGENVAGLIALGLDGVLADLEGEGYASRAIVVPACAVNAPHRRDRVWIVGQRLADRGGERRQQVSGGAPGDEAPDAGRPTQGDHQLASRSEGRLADGDGERPGEARQLCGRAAQWPAGRGEGGLEHPARQRRGEGRTESELRQWRDPAAPGAGRVGDADDARPQGRIERWQRAGQWDAWATGRTLAGRRIPEPGIRLLAHGIPGRIPRLRAAGNAIVPQVAAEILRALRP
ncbi:DNA (cytosine-5)-methyltransferase 1 [Lysobacter sp. yr284]|uniref:DNA cytosine methyltransferase n=1 Tax=Lysobacter sp. yr284 TaxID=1761791 RepID=UPI0008966869|nr:DNA cytosine methyltransferase [Lysobacter sp. yr284]SDZ20279.1 DNA (cytosine-5)-methyltransferase 1 [Lysobacter sp. yr284]